MRWTNILLPTLREAPTAAPGIARTLLVRAGLVRETESGLALLPLGERVLRKLSDLLRQSLTDLRGAEIRLPAGDSTQSAAELIATAVHSYKQLPQTVFQIERTEESLASLIAFSFHSTEADLSRKEQKLQSALTDILNLCGIKPALCESRAGKRLIAFSDHGADAVMVSNDGGYVADSDAARTAGRPWSFAGEPMAELEKVHTPKQTKVDEVCAFMNVSPRQILKTLVFDATSTIPVNWLVAVVRGDHQVNVPKLTEAAQALGVTSLALADSPELREKFAIGFVGPDAGTKVPDAVLVVDPDAAQGNVAWVAGANETDYHVRNFNWFREAGDKLADPAKVLVADIRDAIEGDPAPPPARGVLHRRRAVALGRIESLGTAVTESSRALFDDEAGARRPLLMGRYELDLIAVMHACVETSHDEHGILWPAPIAPASVILTPIKYEGEVKQIADELYTRLAFERIDAILDDRDARAGSKFADADLVGFPIRINIGDKNLRDRHVEIKFRNSPLVERVPIDDVARYVRAGLALNSDD